MKDIEEKDNLFSKVEGMFYNYEDLKKEIKYFEEEIELKRIERAIANFTKEEEEMFKIRYLLKIKDWEIYAEQMNVSKAIYYAIRYNMIYRAISVIYPFYKYKDTDKEEVVL